MGEEANEEEVCCLYLSGFFLDKCSVCVEGCCPLVRVLRLVDGERKPAIGYIYEAMDRAKEAIARAFDDNEARYKDIFEIIDKRLEIQLHRPLHAVGHYLNHEFLLEPSYSR